MRFETFSERSRSWSKRRSATSTWWKSARRHSVMVLPLRFVKRSRQRWTNESRSLKRAYASRGRWGFDVRNLNRWRRGNWKNSGENRWKPSAIWHWHMTIWQYDSIYNPYVQISRRKYLVYRDEFYLSMELVFYQIYRGVVVIKFYFFCPFFVKRSTVLLILKS